MLQPLLVRITRFRLSKGVAALLFPISSRGSSILLTIRNNTLILAHTPISCVAVGWRFLLFKEKSEGIYLDLLSILQSEGKNVKMFTVGGIIGYKDKKKLLMAFNRVPRRVTLGQQYHIGEKLSGILYTTYINSHAETQ